VKKKADKKVVPVPNDKSKGKSGGKKKK